MPVAPSGPISLMLDNLRNLVAASATFQAWTQTANATLAKAFTYPIDLPAQEGQTDFTAAQLAEMRPLAIVDLFRLPGRSGLEAYSSDRTAEGAFTDSGKLLLSFEADVPEEYSNSPADAEMDFLNKVGGILADMEALGGQDGYLSVHNFEILIGPWRGDQTKIASQGDFFKMILLVSVGI